MPKFYWISMGFGFLASLTFFKNPHLTLDLHFIWGRNSLQLMHENKVKNISKWAGILKPMSCTNAAESRIYAILFFSPKIKWSFWYRKRKLTFILSLLSGRDCFCLSKNNSFGANFTPTSATVKLQGFQSGFFGFSWILLPLMMNGGT